MTALAAFWVGVLAGIICWEFVRWGWREDWKVGRAEGIRRETRTKGAAAKRDAGGRVGAAGIFDWEREGAA